MKAVQDVIPPPSQADQLPPCSQPVDVVLTSNGPGEVVTWVKPVVQALRGRFGNDPAALRITVRPSPAWLSGRRASPHPALLPQVLLAPCPHASGREASFVRTLEGVDRVLAPEDFWRFLLTKHTPQPWDWRPRGPCPAPTPTAPRLPVRAACAPPRAAAPTTHDARDHAPPRAPVPRVARASPQAS